MWKFWLGLLILIGAIALGLYVGVWVMFIGGIIGLVEAFVAMMDGVVMAKLIGISIVKMIFASVVGFGSFYALGVPAWLLIGKGLE